MCSIKWYKSKITNGSTYSNVVLEPYNVVQLTANTETALSFLSENSVLVQNVMVNESWRHVQSHITIAV